MKILLFAFVNMKIFSQSYTFMSCETEIFNFLLHIYLPKAPTKNNMVDFFWLGYEREQWNKQFWFLKKRITSLIYTLVFLINEGILVPTLFFKCRKQTHDFETRIDVMDTFHNLYLKVNFLIILRWKNFQIKWKRFKIKM